MKVLDVIALILLLIGGINWGLVGLFNFDVVTECFGMGTMLTHAVYVLVGLSALYRLFFMSSIHKRWCNR